MLLINQTFLCLLSYLELYLEFHVNYFSTHDIETLNRDLTPRRWSKKRRSDPHPRLLTCTATYNPRPAIRDPRSLVKLYLFLELEAMYKRKSR